MLREKRIRKIIILYRKLFLVFLGIIGLLLIFVGSIRDNLLASLFGTALFTATTVVTIYRVIGFDVYLSSILKDMLIAKNFIGMLNARELKEIIKESIIALRRSTPSSHIYEAFERLFVDRLGEIVQTNRAYRIELKPVTGKHQEILRARIKHSAIYYNEASTSRPLFGDDVVARGQVSPPPLRARVRIPEAPTEIFSFKRMEIDGQGVKTDAKIEWIDANDKTKGVAYDVRFRRILRPAEQVHVAYETESMLGMSDFVVRRFVTFSEGEVEIVVRHPRNIQPQIVWFTHEPPFVRITRAISSSTTYVQRAEGVLVPGNGFALFWSPKE